MGERRAWSFWGALGGCISRGQGLLVFFHCPNAFIVHWIIADKVWLGGLYPKCQATGGVGRAVGRWGRVTGKALSPLCRTLGNSLAHRSVCVCVSCSLLELPSAMSWTPLPSVSKLKQFWKWVHILCRLRGKVMTYGVLLLAWGARRIWFTAALNHNARALTGILERNCIQLLHLLSFSC